MNTVIHFGAGNIGRGFIGCILSKAGYRVVFADVNADLVEQLAAKGRYTVRTVGGETTEETIESVTAYASDDEALLAVACDATLITTAVGPGVLPRLAPTVSRLLRHRREQGIEAPVNVIACENMVGGSKRLSLETLRYMGLEEREWVAGHVGFPDSVVDRIVPPGTDPADPLAVSVEPFHEWIVDRTGCLGEPPAIAGMQLTDNLPAYVERKLFTLNTGHSVAAYLGKQAGHRTILESVADPVIRKVVRHAMIESGAVLIRRHGFDAKQHEAYIDKILSRFDNPALRDSVDRVGRDPARKLSGGDRFILPMKLASAYGLPYSNLLEGAVAAFGFVSDEEPQPDALQRLLRKFGIRETVRRLSGLPDGDPVLETLIERVERLDPVRFEAKEGA